MPIDSTTGYLKLHIIQSQGSNPIDNTCNVQLFPPGPDLQNVDVGRLPGALDMEREEVNLACVAQQVDVFESQKMCSLTKTK